MSKTFYIASCVFTEEIRCCVDKYKVEEFEQRMPEWYRPQWQSITHFQKFPRGATMVSLCHNCAAIFEERHPEIKCLSLWELILSDEQFQYPDLGGEPITVQDCWRSKENRAEQDAVRSILRRMNARNAKLAPKRFVEGAKGLFEPHSDDEKRRLMVEYCRQIKTPRVVCYCHYCLRGLKLGGADGHHLAQMLFDSEVGV